MIGGKLPAYGARLRDRRRRGELPLCVHLIFGYDWRAEVPCGWGHLPPAPHPMIALRPEDYVPGQYDFSLLLGLQVCVFDQLGSAAYYDDVDLGPALPHRANVWHLLGELSAVAAEVVLHSPAFNEVWRACELARYRRPERLLGWRSVSEGWPFWWSEEIEKQNAKRRQTWCRIALDPGQLECA